MAPRRIARIISLPVWPESSTGGICGLGGSDIGPRIRRAAPLVAAATSSIGEATAGVAEHGFVK